MALNLVTDFNPYLRKMIQRAKAALIWGGVVMLLLLLCFILFSIPIASYKLYIKSIGSWAHTNSYIFPLAYPILFFLTFTFDRIVANRLRKNEAKRNWYTKALLDPHLKDIQAFFSTIIDDYKTAQFLYSRRVNIDKSDDLLTWKAKRIEDFHSKIRKIEFDLIMVVGKTHPDLAQELMKLLNEVLDIYTNGIDELNNEIKSDITDMQKQLAEVKGQFMQALGKRLF